MALSSADDTSRPSPARFGVLGFACSLSLITYLDRICIMRVSKNMREDLLFSPIEMGWVFAAFAVGYTLFEVPGGWMGDRWGARRVLMRIVIWWSIFTVMTGLVFPVEGFPLVALAVMLLVRFMFGVGEAGAYPNLARVVRVWFPVRERAFAQGGIWMCARLGGAIAPLVIGRLTLLLGGWRPAFWVLGVIGVVWAFLFFQFYRDRPPKVHVRPELDDAYSPSATAPVVDGHAWPSLRVLAASLTIWAICIVSFCVSLGWYFYPTWQPEYLSEVYGIRYEDSEILTGLPFLCGAAGSLLGGWFSDFLIRLTGNRRWGRSLLGVVGFGLAGVCVVATGFTNAWWQAVLLLCLAFFFNDLAIPVIWAVCADVGGRFVGSVAGLMNMTGGVGALLCPILIPILLEKLWPSPSPSAGMAAGSIILPALPHTFGASERWEYVFLALATTWFVGAAAWLFVDASKPIFSERR